MGSLESGKSVQQHRSPLDADRGAAELPADSSALTISLIIATIRRSEALDRALASVLASTGAPVEVLVVDGSAEGEAAPVVQRYADLAPFPVLHLTCPPGLTRQRNVGLVAARGDIVVFLDDDARLTPPALEGLRSAYASHDVVGATGHIIESANYAIGGQRSLVRRLWNLSGRPGTFTSAGYPRRLQDPTALQDVEFMQGAFMSARTGAARSVGFDENLPGYALAEDEDFSCRLGRLGRIRYLGDIRVYHDNTGFSTRDRVQFSRMVVRHRRYLFRKNFPQTVRSRFAFGRLIAILMVHRLLNGDPVSAWTLGRTALWDRRFPIVDDGV